MAKQRRTQLRSKRNFPGYLVLDYEYAPALTSDAHTDGEAKISIVIEGALKETQGRQEAWAGPLSMVIKPSDALHANRFGPEGSRIISLISTGGARWPEGLDESFMQEYQWFHDLKQAGVVTEFLRGVVSAQNQDDLETALIQLVASVSATNNKTPAGDPPDWLKTVAEKLTDCWDESLQVRELAAQAQVHPVYLARIFRQYFHCNPKQYQHHIRLQRALHQLSRTEKLVQVALDSGFADQSHFSRLFKASTGISPGNYRKLLQEL